MAPISLKGLFIPALMYSLLRSRTTPVQESPIEDEYDYVVVGSGWGGSVVANRLTEDPGTRVLILEAGAKDNVSSEIPLLSLSAVRGGYDWNYLSTPQERACWGMKDKRCLIPAGKVEGGSSILDVLLFSRPHTKTIERWSVPGWTGDEINKYIVKYQDYHQKDIDECNPVGDKYGCGGPVFIGPLAPESRGVTTDMFIEGAKETLGLEQHDNIVEKPGVDEFSFFMRKGVRVGASSAYLKPVSKSRQNLHISLNTFVRKILIDPSTKKATGVQYEKDGVVKEVKAKKEVIVSAGTFGSPKLLMLSGIGPKEDLDKLDIPVIADVPGVGKNFKDLLSTIVIFTTGNMLPKEELQLIDTDTIRNWAKGKGMMNTPSGIDAAASFRSSLANKDDPTEPDYWLIVQTVAYHQIIVPILQKAFGFTDEYWGQLIKPLTDMQSVTVHPSVVVEGSGTLTLMTNNPKDDLIIEPNYLSNDNDMQRLIEAVRMSMKLGDSKSFKDAGYKISPHTFEACKQFTDKTSDDYIKCFIKYGMLTRYLNIGTCKMGSESDGMAVVNERLKVRGVTGLRVVDASVMPDQVSAPIAGTVIAVAEKGVDMIKEDNR